MTEALENCPFCGYEVRKRTVSTETSEEAIQIFYCKDMECNAIISFAQPYLDTTKLFNQRIK